MPPYTPDDERVAADPTTSQEELWRLALDHPDLRPLIAMNPAAPKELRAGPSEGAQAPSSAAGGSPATTRRVVSAAAGDGEAGNRRKMVPVLVALMLAVTLVLVLAVTVVVLLGGQSPQVGSPAPGGEQTGASQEASGQPEATVTVTQTEVAEPANSPQGTASPVSLEALGAKGCEEAAADADLLVAYGWEYSNDSGWDTAHAEDLLERQIVRLEQACGRNYVMRVATMAERSGATDAVNATLYRIMATPVRPAPQGAFFYDLVVSPSGNIMCHLQGEYVSCNILEFSYQDCGWPHFDMYVGLDGVVGTCGPGVPSDRGGNVVTLQYGQSAAFGAFACTSESTGMTCWHTTTGHGFKLSRESYTDF